MKKILTLLLFATTTVAYAQKRKLELNLQKDSTYLLSMTAKVDVDQLIQGTHQLVKTSISANIACKVTSLVDTIYKMDVVYNSTKMGMEVAGRQLNFDSQGDSTNMLNKALRAMTGKVFNISLSKRGKITDVQNNDNLFKDMLNAFSQASEQQKTQLITQLKQSFGENTIKGNFQESFVIFSKLPVGVGSTWANSNLTESAGFAIKTNTTFTLNAITENSYDISGAGVIISGKAPAFKSYNKFFMRLTNVSGGITAKIKIDRNTGWIIESHLIENIKGTIELKQTETGPVAMSYPMTILGDVNTVNK